MSYNYAQDYAWNPDDFLEAYSFYRTKHEQLLTDYVAEKFQKNSTKMNVRATAITKRIVQSMSSVYKENIKREFKSVVDEKLIDNANLALHDAEELKNLTGTALMWYYDSKIKALGGQDFTLKMDGSEVITVFVRYKDVYNDNGQQAYQWLKYENNVISIGTGLTFTSIENWTLEGSYDQLPFLLVNSELETVEPIVSPFIAIEKDFAGGLALNRLSMAISILRLLIAVGGDQETVNYLSEVVGNFTGVAGLPTTITDIKSLDMGDSQTNVDFLELNKQELRLLAVQYGANYTSLDVDENIESGKAKELKLDYMNSVRVSSIPRWKNFEYKFWLWLSLQDSGYKELEVIDFGTLNISLTASENEELKVMTHDANYRQVETGLMSASEYARIYYPNDSDQEIKLRATRIEENLL